MDGLTTLDGLFELFYDWVERRWGALAAWIATICLFGLFAGSLIWFVVWLNS